MARSPAGACDGMALDQPGNARGNTTFHRVNQMPMPYFAARLEARRFLHNIEVSGPLFGMERGRLADEGLEPTRTS